LSKLASPALELVTEPLVMELVMELGFGLVEELAALKLTGL
jgi:hypothetical protein